MIPKPIARAYLAKVMEPTWPSASWHDLGPFRLRQAKGGGKRVGAATAEADWTLNDLQAAQAAMDQPLFTIREGDEALDQTLADLGYHIVDPVVIYRAASSDLAQASPVMAHWPPLALVREIWAQNDIGPARLAIMERVKGAKTALMARHKDRLGALGFVGSNGQEAMLHALVTVKSARRQGLARHLLHAAGAWATAQNLEALSLAVTTQNLAARALYEQQGMEIIGAYHYRIKL